MTERVYAHVRQLGNLLNPVDDLAEARQVNLHWDAPAGGATLVRTRLWLDFRVVHYLYTGDAVNISQWWQDMTPIFGVLVTDTLDDPVTVDDPIGGKDNPNWVEWGMAVGQFDGSGPDEDFPSVTYVTYKWSPAGGMSESFAERKTTVGNFPKLWLVWNWIDRHNKINLSSGASSNAFDLSINYAIDTIWLTPAT